MADANASDPTAVASDINRTAVLELLGLIAAGIVLVVLVMYLLNWAAQATGSTATAAEAVDFDNRSISVIVLQEPPDSRQPDASISDDEAAEYLPQIFILSSGETTPFNVRFSPEFTSGGYIVDVKADSTNNVQWVDPGL